MSESEEDESITYYGTPLDPYDEDSFPKKKPINIEDQVAKDAQGRRRFHGAFTGGYSAGFFNTVGSLEGWTPREFKSTRSEKAKNLTQTPTDFMDDEDIGEFGIAPQKVQATKEFSHRNKRKKEVVSTGPIPGNPVLQSVIESASETVGYYILKNMTTKQKKQIKKEVDESITQKVYGCEMPKQLENIEEIFKETYLLPDTYKNYLKNCKSNTAGLGHCGLNTMHTDSSSKNKQTPFTMRDKNNKKISIGGQAFGVGAFEEEDDDIYSKDDMTNYDFELSSEKHSESHTSRKSLGEFVQSKAPLIFKNNFPSPVVPSSFTGIHNVKKSRFEPLPEDKEKSLPKRKEIDASVRAKYLGDDNSTTEDKIIPKECKDNKEIINSNLLMEKFVSASKTDESAETSVDVTHGSKEMRDAVRLKMFGPLTRKTTQWEPNSLVCNRFNVPEPQHRNDTSMQVKKRTKNLIFEYQKHNEDISLISGINNSSSFLENISKSSKSDSEIKEIINEAVATENNQKDTPSTSVSNEIKVENETETTVVKNYNEKLDVSKQIDLFKAIFLSSESESEETDDKQEEQNRLDMIKESVLSDSLLPKIKSNKEGILSNIDFSSLNKNKTNESNKIVESVEKMNEVEIDVSEKTTGNVEENIYGPKLPDKKICNAPNKINSYDTLRDTNNEQWIEKDSKRKKRKHKKKRSKEKHKDKRK